MNNDHQTQKPNKVRNNDPIQIDISKMPIPHAIPEDSADLFVIDIGTYVPPVSKLHEHHVRRRPRQPCRNETRILIGLKSAPNSARRRDAIRKTWGNARHYENYPAQVVFLLGLDSAQAEKKFDELEKDDDLLVGDFVDSFHNLTYKDSLFLTWMKHECPSATYVFKGDDDTLVNPFELEKLIKKEDERQALLEKPMGSVYGSLMQYQPVNRGKGRYGDKLWPSNHYPTYVSGGGFLMNRKAAMAIQYYIKITPKIDIDDAFIGALIERAGPQDYRLFRDKSFHSWGFKTHKENKFDVCEIDKLIYFHKFLPNEMNCFWPKFINNRQLCADPNYKYEEEGELCDRHSWYKSRHLSVPNLANNEIYHRCGPDFNNSVCSVKEADWNIRKPPNGPCCSANGFCGSTPDHCDCPVGCINFKAMAEKSQLEEKHRSGQCCQFIKVESGMSYSGVYSLVTDDKSKLSEHGHHVEYVKKVSKNDAKFTIELGGFSKHGKGWYILTEARGGLTWQLKDAATCPPLGDWGGYGAVLSCVDVA